MVNLAQVIKQLRAEQSRARREVDRFEKALGALQRLARNQRRQTGRNDTAKRRKVSAAARKKMSQAQKERWAKFRLQAAKA